VWCRVRSAGFPAIPIELYFGNSVIVFRAMILIQVKRRLS
jgi:hypothetical protein